jgi:hypothetical protein
MPLLKSIGFIPAATDLHPSLKIALANIVAVVVPSPALSFACYATCLIKLAPILWYLLANSISLATVTPSLVIFGDPNVLSRTTFLPLGPSVTETASASMSAPSSINALASVPNLISFPNKN